MSVAFSSDGSDVINRKLESLFDSPYDKLLPLDDAYEIHKCKKWIKSNDYAKIALQFPDSLLSDSAEIALKLEEQTHKQVFILGDTSYGSCCVDEVAAEHVSADAIIHFGHACLSPSQRLPVLYCFGKRMINIQDVINNFEQFFPDRSSKIILFYEVTYFHALGAIKENLKDYSNLIISNLEVPNCGSSFKLDANDNDCVIRKCGRYFTISASSNLLDYSIFYIGSKNVSLTNAMLSFNECKFYTYDPTKRLAQVQTLDINNYLKKRYYYIEKSKDAKIIGILVGTLGVTDYLSIINHLKEVIRKAGRKSYTLVVGKLNPAKLANFPEIDVFVNVACIESSVVDCSEFYQPIITPYELEIALNQARQWSGDYITDFSELLPGSLKHIPPSEIETIQGDVSLITGKMRSFSVENDVEKSSDNSAIISRDQMTLSTVHQQAAGEYLNERSWKGLEQHLGETPVYEIQQGKKGIACKYHDENT